MIFVRKHQQWRQRQHGTASAGFAKRGVVRGSIGTMLTTMTHAGAGIDTMSGGSGDVYASGSIGTMAGGAQYIGAAPAVLPP